MKALFYGGAIASLAGLALGFGMQLPSDPPGAVGDAQSTVEPVAAATPESVAYGSMPEAYPPSYVINAGYMGEPVTELRPEVASADDQPAIDRVLETAWTSPDEPSEAAPQDIAAAGDTTAFATPAAEPEVRTYASIDAVLNAQKPITQAAGPSL